MGPAPTTEAWLAHDPECVCTGDRTVHPQIKRASRLKKREMLVVVELALLQSQHNEAGNDFDDRKTSAVDECIRYVIPLIQMWCLQGNQARRTPYAAIASISDAADDTNGRVSGQ